MTSREDRARVHVEIPVETKKALKDADAPMWKVLDEGARLALGIDEGSTEAAVEQRLDEVRKERREIQEQVDDLQGRLDELNSIEDELVGRLDSIREKKQTYKQHLDTILKEMEGDADNRPVLAWMDMLRDAAITEYGSDSKENIRRVTEDLRQRATEQGHSIEPSRLTRTTSAANAAYKAATDGGSDDDLRILNGGSDE